MGIDASEISEILKSEIEGLANEGEISEVGTVLTVGTLLFAFGIGPCVALGLYLVDKLFD